MNTTIRNIVPIHTKTLHINTLLNFSHSRSNDEYLAIILIAQRCETSTLPFYLGLSLKDFEALLRHHFPGCEHWLNDLPQSALTIERQQIRQQLLELRQDECMELTNLLLQFRRQSDPSEQWLAQIIAAGCFGTGHLWKDLGLESRIMLRQLLHTNFPELVERNKHDMRWKKFFYRLLCEAQGGLLCRVPDCRLCSSFAECFQGRQTNAPLVCG